MQGCTLTRAMPHACFGSACVNILMTRVVQEARGGGRWHAHTARMLHRTKTLNGRVLSSTTAGVVTQVAEQSTLDPDPLPWTVKIKGVINQRQADAGRQIDSAKIVRVYRLYQCLSLRFAAELAACLRLRCRQIRAARKGSSTATALQQA